MAYQMPLSTTSEDAWLWLRGSGPPPESSRAIETGRFHALADGSDIRRLAYDDVEILRRAYAAIRDPNWGTVEPVEADVVLDDVRLRWQATFRTSDLALEASGEYELRSDGVLIAGFRADAQSGFRFNRIGLCVLLPPQEFAGQPFAAEGPDGRIDGVLPERIGEQRIVDGLPAPLFAPFSSLELAGRSGVRVFLTFEGDLFEAEDQRNWTDDSFKIYSTPLALGFPHRAVPGQRFEQRITVRTEPPSRHRPRTGAEVVEIRVGESLVHPLPRLGLGGPSHEELPGDTSTELLRALQIGRAHV